MTDHEGTTEDDPSGGRPARDDDRSGDAERAAQAAIDRGWARVASMGREFASMAVAARLPSATLRYGRAADGRAAEGFAADGFVADGSRDGWVLGIDEDGSGSFQLAVLDDGRWAVWHRRPDGDETLAPASWATFGRFFSAWADVGAAMGPVGDERVEDAVAAVRRTLAARLRG